MGGRGPEPEVMLTFAVVAVLALAFLGWMDAANKWTPYAARVAVAISVTIAVVGTTLLFVVAHER